MVSSERSPTRLCLFSVPVQHLNGNGDVGDPRSISRLTTNWRANNHEPSLRWWRHHLAWEVGWTWRTSIPLATHQFPRSPHIAGTLSGWFRIKRRIRQGCVLFPYLCNILTEMVTRETLDRFQGWLQIKGRILRRHEPSLRWWHHHFSWEVGWTWKTSIFLATHQFSRSLHTDSVHSIQYCLFSCIEQFYWDLIRTCGFAICCLMYGTSNLWTKWWRLLLPISCLILFLYHGTSIHNTISTCRISLLLSLESFKTDLQILFKITVLSDYIVYCLTCFKCGSRSSKHSSVAMSNEAKYLSTKVHFTRRT